MPDLSKTPPIGGKKTHETRILVCECSSTKFEVKKQTKTSVSLECEKCQRTMSVKGSTALVRIGETEITYAVKEHIIGPDPDAGKNKDGGEVDKKPTLSSQGHVMLRFKLTPNQRDLINRASECIRIMNVKDEKYREQQWHGSALEFMAADFISGVDPNVLLVVEAMEEAADIEIKKAEDEGVTQAVTKRKVRRIRAKVRDEMSIKLGIVESKNYEPEKLEPEPEPEPFYKEVPPRKTIPDGGRFMRSIKKALEEYSEQCTEEAGVPVEVLVEYPGRSTPIRNHWKRAGGFLVRVLGDKKMADVKGKRPEAIVFVSDDVSGCTLDFETSYDDAVSDLLPENSIEVIEILPSGFKDMPEDEQWSGPHFVDRREIEND